MNRRQVATRRAGNCETYEEGNFLHVDYEKEVTVYGTEVSIKRYRSEGFRLPGSHFCALFLFICMCSLNENGNQSTRDFPAAETCRPNFTRMSKHSFFYPTAYKSKASNVNLRFRDFFFQSIMNV